MKLKECVGRIVKGVNTTHDVGVDQISIEAKKFGIEVDKDGKPKDDYSKWIKGLAENIVASNFEIILESSFPQDYDISDDILEILDEENFNFDDSIIRNEDLILYNKTACI